MASFAFQPVGLFVLQFQGLARRQHAGVLFQPEPPALMRRKNWIRLVINREKSFHAGYSGESASAYLQWQEWKKARSKYSALRHLNNFNTPAMALNFVLRNVYFAIWTSYHEYLWKCRLWHNPKAASCKIKIKTKLSPKKKIFFTQKINFYLEKLRAKTGGKRTKFLAGKDICGIHNW